MNLALDCARAEFITPERAVISLKGGEIYVVSLLSVDRGIRSVRGFHFDRAAASVLTTSLACIEGKYLFLGSRLGNSLLLSFKEKDLGAAGSALSKELLGNGGKYLFHRGHMKHTPFLICRTTYEKEKACRMDGVRRG